MILDYQKDSYDVKYFEDVYEELQLLLEKGKKEPIKKNDILTFYFHLEYVFDNRLSKNEKNTLRSKFNLKNIERKFSTMEPNFDSYFENLLLLEEDFVATFKCNLAILKIVKTICANDFTAYQNYLFGTDFVVDYKYPEKEDFSLIDKFIDDFEKEKVKMVKKITMVQENLRKMALKYECFVKIAKDFYSEYLEKKDQIQLEPESIRYMNEIFSTIDDRYIPNYKYEKEQTVEILTELLNNVNRYWIDVEHSNEIKEKSKFYIYDKIPFYRYVQCFYRHVDYLEYWVPGVYDEMKPFLSKEMFENNNISEFYSFGCITKPQFEVIYKNLLLIYSLLTQKDYMAPDYTFDKDSFVSFFK